jgi:hypothetical protein
MNWKSTNLLCKCGMLTVSLDPQDITGLSRLKKTIVLAKLRKDAKRVGYCFVEHKTKKCGGCGHEFGPDTPVETQTFEV